MPSRVMTEGQYVWSGGGVCPCCRGDMIEGGSIEVDGSQAIQEVVCNDCHAEWTDQYNLSGYSLTNNPASKDEDKNEDPNG